MTPENGTAMNGGTPKNDFAVFARARVEAPKKSIYAVVGALFILSATLLQRFDGGGGDVAGLIVLGLLLLISSADVPQRKARDGP